jgi:hypothetical protein
LATPLVEVIGSSISILRTVHMHDLCWHSFPTALFSVFVRENHFERCVATRHVIDTNFLRANPDCKTVLKVLWLPAHCQRRQRVGNLTHHKSPSASDLIEIRFGFIQDSPCDRLLVSWHSVKVGNGLCTGRFRASFDLYVMSFSARPSRSHRFQRSFAEVVLRASFSTVCIS